MDILEAFKGAPRLKDLALVMGFAQGAIRVHSDSRLVQMDYMKFVKALEYQGGDCRPRYGALKP